jgi:hypothetical protein
VVHLLKLRFDKKIFNQGGIDFSGPEALAINQTPDGSGFYHQLTLFFKGYHAGKAHALGAFHKSFYP